MKNIDLDKLRGFYHVATLNSFSKAAERMNLNQSSVSRQILYLERILETKLFHRRGNTLQITKQGEILLKYTDEILKSIRTAQSILDDDEEVVKGPLRVSATVGMASLYIAPYIADFLVQHPDLKLTIIASDVEPQLKLDEVDVAIRPYNEEQPDLIQLPLFTTHSKLYASPEYLERFGVPKTAKDLDNHRLIAFGDSTNHPFSEVDWHLRIGRADGKVREPYIESNLAQNRCQLSEAGLGIISISVEHPGLKDMNLVEVLPNLKGPEISAYYTYAPELKNSKRISSFYEYLKKFLN